MKISYSWVKKANLDSKPVTLWITREDAHYEQALTNAKRLMGFNIVIFLLFGILELQVFDMLYYVMVEG